MSQDLPNGQMPQASQIRQVAQTIIRQELYQGPMPHPDILAKYETLCPGTAKRLFDQLQEQTHHRMSMEKTVITANVRSSRLGQWMGFTICMTALVGGGVMAAFGIDTAGLILAVGGLVSLVAVFMAGRLTGQKELRAKRQ
ncbi:MAG: DUF2335 domain-containing protein [Spirochaetia bacterium]